MARDAAWEAELLEQALHAARVLRHMRVDLAVGPFEPGIRNNARAPMARTGDVNHVEIACFNRAVEMHVDEVQPRGRAPMPQEARLDVLEFERLFQQRIVEQINLPDGKVIRRAPPGVDPGQLFRRQRVGGVLQNRVSGHREFLARTSCHQAGAGCVGRPSGSRSSVPPRPTPRRPASRFGACPQHLRLRRA